MMSEVDFHNTSSLHFIDSQILCKYILFKQHYCVNPDVQNVTYPILSSCPGGVFLTQKVCQPLPLFFS